MILLPQKIAALLARHASKARSCKVSGGGIALAEENHDYQIEFRPASPDPAGLAGWLAPEGLALLRLGGDVQIGRRGESWTAQLAAVQAKGKARKTAAALTLPKGAEGLTGRDARGGLRYGVDPVALKAALHGADKIAPRDDDRHGFAWLECGEVLATDGTMAIALPGGWYGHAFAPSLNAAVTIEAARVWLAMLGALAKDPGRWGLECDGAVVALVHEGAGGETRVAARLREPNFKTSRLRAILKEHGAAALPVVHLDADFVRRALRLFEYMAVYQNGAIFAWNKGAGIDTGISAPLAGDVLWTGHTARFLDLLPKRAAKDWPSTIPVEVSGAEVFCRVLQHSTHKPGEPMPPPVYVDGVFCCKHELLSVGGGTVAAAGRFPPSPEAEDFAPVYGIIRAALPARRPPRRCGLSAV